MPKIDDVKKVVLYREGGEDPGDLTGYPLKVEGFRDALRRVLTEALEAVGADPGEPGVHDWVQDVVLENATCGRREYSITGRPMVLVHTWRGKEGMHAVIERLDLADESQPGEEGDD